MRSSIGRVALLLFGSGFCALVYQTAWLRMFRLIFGASTAASAAVLAIFMGGLGFGSLLLGKRADRHPSPLGLYALLEAGIALSAGLSPWLLALVEKIYVALGGSARLGLAGSSAVRLLLAILVLALPTFLMGGTLPAVSRAVERSADLSRRTVGLLYGANTLGAVVGALVTTFVSIELLGIRKTIWIAALVNLLVVLAARSLARHLAARGGEAGSPTAPAAEPADVQEERVGGGWLVPFAAGVVGFAFLLMELVWYRMLGPLLGGSSYTFGLILAVALLGIGLGGLLYGAGERGRRPTLLSFAGTCSLEAMLLALPFALGDRVAVLAALLRPLAGPGFYSLVAAWALITALVVLPAAVVSGYQFPLLIALLGSSRQRVGREVGLTYAANTLGAILGSIAGGFGLIPLLTAPGVWRLVAVLLLALAALAIMAGLRSGAPFRAAGVPLVAGVVGLLLCTATGPSAFWRHTPIGAGRVSVLELGDPNAIRGQVREMRRRIVWQADGVESSVALDLTDEYAFIVNGKADGSAIGDAPTQVMSGLVGALVHPHPRRALVIGLGTGSTAGWLARVPGMERVDVVELEPAIREVARACTPVNQDALRNPKVHLVFDDGREFLLTTASSYDLIFSEPSNPYRAGIASLFSADFYQALRQHLRPGGVFLQWLQGYEVDPRVVRTAYATLGSVFPAVESWQVHSGDLLLMASREPRIHDLDLVRARAGQEPFRSALWRTWGVAGAEGFYSSYLASPAFARAVREAEGDAINTDDRPILEFGFAKNLGRTGLFNLAELVQLAAARGESRPATRGASLDWNRVRDLRAARDAYWGSLAGGPVPAGDPAARARLLAREAYQGGSLESACRLWFEQPEPPLSHLDLLLVGECLAGGRDPRAPAVAARLAQEQPIEAELILARWHAAAGRPAVAGEHLLAALAAYQRDPWVYRPLVQRSFPLAVQVSQADRSLAPRLYAALGRPSSTRMFEDHRLRTRIVVAPYLADPARCLDALAPFEPNVPWEEPFLAFRYRCYQERQSPLAGRARRDLEEYREAAPLRLADGLSTSQPPP